MKPYEYQEEAIESCIEYFKFNKGRSPIIVAPTGSGKSVIQAFAIEIFMNMDCSMKIGCLAHRKELLTQNAEALTGVNPQIPYGFFSASLNKRETKYSVTFGQVQSIFNKAEYFGEVDFLFIDECQYVAESDESMYRVFIEKLKIKNPKLKVIGLTATPFRLKGGKTVNIFGGENDIFDGICYEIPMTTLLEQGKLCPIYCYQGKTGFDLSKARRIGGDYQLEEMQKAFDIDSKVTDMCEEIVEASKNAMGVLIFSSGKEHAEHIKLCLETLEPSEKVCSVFGDTDSTDRSITIDLFKRREVKYLINYGVFTEGFDVKHIDVLVLARATVSHALYMQMVGRQMRTHPEKSYGILLDFGDNVKRLGCVDQISYKQFSSFDPNRPKGDAPVKECPECFLLQPTSIRNCLNCEHEFEFQQLGNVNRMSSKDNPLGGSKVNQFSVVKCETSRHERPGKTPSLRVDFHTSCYKKFSIWLCVEHSGFAYNQAVTKCKQLKIQPMPDSVDEGLSFEPMVESIWVDESSKFPNILSFEGVSEPRKRDIQFENTYEEEYINDDDPFGVSEFMGSLDDDIPF